LKIVMWFPNSGYRQRILFDRGGRRQSQSSDFSRGYMEKHPPKTSMPLPSLIKDLYRDGGPEENEGRCFNSHVSL